MNSVTIPVKLLSHEKQIFDFHLDESFIESFSNKEITDLCCDVEIEASRDGAWGEILCKIVGHLTVP